MKIILISLGFLLLACQASDNDNLSADTIVKKAISYAGGKKYDSLKISFDFRDIHYEMERNQNDFTMTRSQLKVGDSIVDTYNNDSFQREINGQAATVSDSMASLYRQSINSVFYFALLPYKLEDASVLKTSLGIDTIKGKAYHLIQVKFKEEGGGEDHEDVYLYWFNQQNFALDYLAYSFDENEGGLRFREAYNERTINGLRLVDYKNYKPKDKTIALNELSKEFNQGKLELLSKIDLKNVVVE